MLIFVFPVAYFPVVEKIQESMMAKELKEIADYVANTFENLFILSRNASNTLLKKELKIPQKIKDSFYVIEIAVKSADGSVSGTRAYISDKSYICVDSWLVGGLKVGGLRVVHSSHVGVIYACCRRLSSGDVFVFFTLDSV
ncbi:MAG: hypothetical protein QXJ07_04315 [Candidatus Bathyarchaeia archaeon]